MATCGYGYHCVHKNYFRKILELEEELMIVGNNKKSLEISGQEVSRLSVVSNDMEFMDAIATCITAQIP